MFMLLETAKKDAIPAKYVLFDSCFSSPSTLHAVKEIGYDVIGMVKKIPKMFFCYNGENMYLVFICNRNKKRCGRTRYLFSVIVDVVKVGEIIRIYGKRWDIEVFFKVCKSYLNLSRECNSLSYDAMTAYTAVFLLDI